MKCISSRWMTNLLTWRNPQGSEDRWFRADFYDKVLRGDVSQSIENRWKHRGKVASTEVGLAFLAVTSIVETVAYAALSLLSAMLIPFTIWPITFVTQLVKSSLTTFFWSVGNAFYFNLRFVNLVTEEVSALRKAGIVFYVAP